MRLGDEAGADDPGRSDDAVFHRFTVDEPDVDDRAGLEGPHRDE